MPLASYLDPSIFHFSNIESILKDVEKLVEEKRKKVEKEFGKFEKKYKKSKQKDQDWYQWQEDYYVDEMFLVSELERNLLNGLAVTANTVFERHVNMHVREISKNDPSIKFNSRHTYKMNELKKMLIKIKHPNNKKFSKDLLNKLRIYTDIRNCIVHHEGKVDSKGLVRPFVLKNKNLFSIKNEQLWIISVNGNYIRRVLKDLEIFFKALCYTENGDIIHY